VTAGTRWYPLPYHVEPHGLESWLCTDKAENGFMIGIDYQVRMIVRPNGAMDYAGDVFDADPLDNGRQNVILWTFRVSSDGTPTVTATEHAPQ